METSEILYYKYRPNFSLFIGIFILFNSLFLIGLVLTNYSPEKNQSFIELFYLPKGSPSKGLILSGLIMNGIINLGNFMNLYNDLTGYSKFIRQGEDVLYYEKNKLKASFPIKDLIGFEMKTVESDIVEHHLLAVLHNNKTVNITYHRYRAKIIGALIAEKLNVKFSK